MLSGRRHTPSCFNREATTSKGESEKVREWREKEKTKGRRQRIRVSVREREKREKRKQEWEREKSQADRWINRQINVDNLKRQNLARNDRNITQTERAGKRKRRRRAFDRGETDEMS